MEWRQLNLLKGRGQRGTRPATPPEIALHCAVADLLRRWIMPGWMFTHIPLGEQRTKAVAAKLTRMGVVAGWPDFIFVGPHRLVFLELKRRHETMSDTQANIAHHIMRSGFDYVCVDNLDDAVATLREFGIVRARVSA